MTHPIASCFYIFCNHGYSKHPLISPDYTDQGCIVDCQNGGTCHSTSHYSYCVCPSGYTGVFHTSYTQTGIGGWNLESSFIECFVFAVCSPACENGGTCMNSYCECPSGYTGDYCQKRVAYYNFGENCVCVRACMCVVHMCVHA